MRQLLFQQRSRAAAVILIAALTAVAELSAIVTGAGRAAADQTPVFTSAPTATIQTEDNGGYVITASCDPACTFSATGDLPPDTQVDSGGFACQGTNHAFWESNYDQSAGWSLLWSPGGSVIGGPAIAAGGAATEPVVEGTNHAIWVRTLNGNWVSPGGQAVGGVGASALN